MKIISHRGNIRGRVPGRENAPSYIDCALGNGYDVEIDVWSIDSILWLGHDEPQYEVTWSWIFKRQDNLWIHCKNVEAAKTCFNFQSFCHSDDPFVFTTNGKIWLHGENANLDIFNEMSIVPLIGEEKLKSFNLTNKIPFGICTDYPSLIKR